MRSLSFEYVTYKLTISTYKYVLFFIINIMPICHFNEHMRGSWHIKYYRIFRGVKAQNFCKVDFELWVGGHGQAIYQQFEGDFGSINPMLPMWGSGPKIKIQKAKIKLSF